MNTQLRCIVFDMDDTLYLERDYVRSGFLHAGALVEKELGGRGFYDAAWELFLEGQRGDIFNRALKRIGLPAPASVIQGLVDAYRNHIPAISLAEDAVQCLDGLHSEYHLALITDGPVVSQENKARALQLDRWIDLNIFTDRWGASYYKPHPLAFLTVQERTGASPNECMYVADNPKKDFTAPTQLGWVTVRIRRDGGLHSHTISHECEPNHELKDLSALIQIVNGNSSFCGDFIVQGD
jgi:putative hydrolase of the HAD superfamily